MLYTLISIIGVVFTIFFVIGTHEFAHFAMARTLGIKVLRFSIGFGKTLCRYTDKKGTEYVFSLIPLGGYVKMLDENEGVVPPQEQRYAYNRQPFYKKFLVVLAGPVMNLACAVALYWVIFIVGFIAIKPITGTITPQSIAADAGLKSGEEIIAIDDNPTRSWTNVIFQLVTHVGNDDNALLTVKTVDNHTATRLLDLSDWQIDDLSPDPLGSIGITPFLPEVPLTIGDIAAKSPAAESGLKIGDKLIALNGVAIKDWQAVMEFISTHPDQSAKITLLRNGKSLELNVHIGYERTLFMQKYGHLGISPTFTWPKDLLQTIQFPPLTAISEACREVQDLAYFNLLLFGKMLTGKLSLQSLGGPITIFSSAGDALNSGVISFLGFLAFLSVSIAVINLLPIPGLDGGHLLIQTIELIIRRPVPDNVLAILYRFGFFLLVFVFLQAFMNDLFRL